MNYNRFEAMAPYMMNLGFGLKHSTPQPHYRNSVLRCQFPLAFSSHIPPLWVTGKRRDHWQAASGLWLVSIFPALLRRNACVSEVTVFCLKRLDYWLHENPYPCLYCFYLGYRLWRPLKLLAQPISFRLRIGSGLWH